MVGMSITLFMSHKRSRAKRLHEIRAYFREQTFYRNSIISMHTNARSRLSMYSASSTHHGSLAQFEETEEGLEDDEDDDRRGLLERKSRSRNNEPEHQQDCEDKGVDYAYRHHGDTKMAPSMPPRRMNSGGRWNAREWGVKH